MILLEAGNNTMKIDCNSVLNETKSRGGRFTTEFLLFSNWAQGHALTLSKEEGLQL